MCKLSCCQTIMKGAIAPHYHASRLGGAQLAKKDKLYPDVPRPVYASALVAFFMFRHRRSRNSHVATIMQGAQPLQS